MCLDDQILNTYLDGELAEPWRTQVAEHLNYCPACNARYEQLRILHKVVSSSRLNEEEIAPYQQKVLKFIENNYVNKRKKIGFIHRNFRVSMPMVLATAAAFVFVLAGAFLFQGKPAGTFGEIIPQVASSTQPGSVVQVRTTEGLASSRFLESYSLEEILQYLDAKGYEVDVRLKGIKPVGTILNQAPFKAPEKADAPVASEVVAVDASQPSEGASE
jgi:predicted anti-sigma-YlaC factor YlaD